MMMMMMMMIIIIIIIIIIIVVVVVVVVDDDVVSDVVNLDFSSLSGLCLSWDQPYSSTGPSSSTFSRMSQTSSP